jgi:hypothetical protein
MVVVMNHGSPTTRERHLSVSEVLIQTWDAPEWDLHAQGSRAGRGIALGMILGLVLWLLIIVATVLLIWAV